MANFAHIEELYQRLLSPDETLTPDEKAEVQHFIDVGEYGLAFETAIDILREKGQKPSEDVVAILGELADAMSLDRHLLRF